jgi:hypothetical protein
MKTRLPHRLVMKRLPRALLGLLLLSATACSTSSKGADETEPEPRERAGAPTATASPYATVRPPSGPFLRRSPPSGPLRAADLREKARVPHAEFFNQYWSEFGLGPKDEMRFAGGSTNPVDGLGSWGYAQYHDGYPVEDGGYNLSTTKEGLVRHIMGGVVLGLPDAPRPVITKERASEIALAEAARHAKMDPVQLSVKEVSSPLWANSPKSPDPGYRLVLRCKGDAISSRFPTFSVDIDVATGERRQFAYNDGSRF